MNAKPSITLYGYGYVGQAVFSFLRDHYKLLVVDPRISDANSVAMTGDGHSYCTEHAKAPRSSHAIVCVPTPMSEDGSCDTSIVEAILRDTEHDFYLVKSTVPPGTCDRLAKETGKSIVFSPEYIGEGKYEIPFWKDLPHPTNMKLHSFHIFGGEPEARAQWIAIWQKVAGWSATYQETDRKTAELVKYAENMFLATKKIFFDELYEVAGVMGVSYNQLKELLLLDGRVGRSMSLIFPDSRGFSGKCLPKDTAGICAAAKAAGYEPKLWQEVIASNKRIRGEV